MPSLTISTAAKVGDLDKAYASALKALSTLGVKMVTKKPDAAKLGLFMVKGKKAEFKLSGTATLIKFTVECENAVNTLGICDLAAEKNVDLRIAQMKDLVAAKLVSKADGDKVIKDLQPGPDPKVVANIARDEAAAKKQLIDAGKLTQLYAAVTSYDIAVRLPPVMEDLEAQAAKEFSMENIDFIKAIAANKKREIIMAEFIGKDAPRQVNLPNAVMDAITKGGDFTAAMAEIKALIKRDTLVRMKTAKRTEIEKLIAAASKRLTDLASMKVKLGIRP